jgi:hypothetical protein
LHDLAEIRAGKAILAVIVARGGVPDSLLPLFLRLEAEETAAGAGQAALDRILDLAAARAA